MGFFDDVDMEEAIEKRHIKKENEPDVNEPDAGELLFNELLPEEGEDGTESSRDPGKKAPASNDGERKETGSENAVKRQAEHGREAAGQEGKKAGQIKNKPAEETAPRKKEEVLKPDGTVISQDTKITGNISTKSGLTVLGEVSGSIEAAGNVLVEETGKCMDISTEADVLIRGKVKGNIHAHNVRIAAKVVRGNINCGTTVTVMEGAALIGGINGKGDIQIYGAVKGNIDSDDKVYLRSTAIVQGNITSAAVIIEDGACIDGTCTQTRMKGKSAGFFDNLEAEDDGDMVIGKQDGEEDSPPIA